MHLDGPLGPTVARGRGRVEPHGAEEHGLPRDRAFVVQLSAQTTVAPASCRGRVEHVASGQATHFHTVAACLACMARVLRERQARRLEEGERAMRLRSPVLPATLRLSSRQPERRGLRRGGVLWLSHRLARLRAGHRLVRAARRTIRAVARFLAYASPITDVRKSWKPPPPWVAR